MLSDLAQAMGMIGVGIDGAFWLLEILVMILLFGAITFGFLYLFWLVARDFWQSGDERQKAFEQFRRNPLSSIWNIVLCVGVLVFFGSLFLSSIGIRTWWK
jgi:hypothetical protein